jgi:hypothetical protein
MIPRLSSHSAVEYERAEGTKVGWGKVMEAMAV